ncbi:MAG: TonB-dependent receptor [Flavobacteriaceae bacterium]|nr:TonB-dependent receptor [Flavobacteriaceae bacterium]
MLNTHKVTRFHLGGGNNVLKTNFALQLFSTDGYIKNSNILKGNFSGRIAHQFSSKSEIALSVLGHKSEWNAPGFIQKAQYENKALRNQPAPTAENDGGRKTFLSERIDFRHKLSDNIKLLAFGYALQQDFTRYMKFAFEPTGQTESFHTRNVYAFGGSLNGNTKLAEKNFDWVAGLEFYTEKSGREDYNTQYRKRLDKIDGGMFNMQTYSIYAQGEWQIHQFFKPSVGLRFDTFGGDHIDNNNETHQIKPLSHISPKLGFRSTLVKNFDFLANVSNGFSLPRGPLKHQENMKPVELWQYEAGFSYNNHKNLFINAVGFILNTNGEVLERPIGSGNFINAGKTKRIGTEIDAKAQIVEGLVFNGSFAYTHTEVVEGPNQGKERPFIPSTIFTLGGTYTSPIGLGADLNFRKVSDYFTDDENNFRDGKYNLVNLKLFYNFDKLFSTKGNVFISINNLLNEHYAESVYWDEYVASPTRNITVGINYSF